MIFPRHLKDRPVLCSRLSVPCSAQEYRSWYRYTSEALVGSECGQGTVPSSKNHLAVELFKIPCHGVNSRSASEHNRNDPDMLDFLPPSGWIGRRDVRTFPILLTT